MSANSALRVTELDFNDIKTNLKTFLKSQNEFSGYDFEGSSMSVLLDILAYNTHYNAFYTNMVANEMFLDSALLRSSVVSKARALGYTPRSVTGATAKINIQITPTDSPSSISIDKNTPFAATVNNITYTFNTTESTTVLKNSSGNYVANNVNIKQGNFIAHSYVANTSDPDQKYIFPNLGTDTSTLVVKLKNSAAEANVYVYNKASDITTVNSTSNIYFTHENTDGRYEITFGDGVLGRKLTSGNVIILESLVSEGSTPNGADTFTVSNNVGGYSNVFITTVSAATGGSERESIESVKFNAPKHYETQNRAVTVNDYRRIISTEYSDADSIAVWGGEDNETPVYGKVFIAVKPKSGLTLTDTAKDYIKQLLKERKVVSVTPEVQNPDYTYMNFDCTVKFNEATSQNTAAIIAQYVKNKIVEFGTNELSNFDLKFRYSKLLREIDKVDPSILNNLLTVTLTKKLTVTIGTSASYKANFSNEIYHPNNTYIGAITSTQFTYNDTVGNSETECFLDDQDGIVRVVKLKLGIRTLIQNNIGTVSYSNGSISLSTFAPNAITGNTVNITVTPAANDVSPVRDQILLISNNDVTVTATTDSTESIGSVVTIGSTSTSGSTSATTSSGY